MSGQHTSSAVRRGNLRDLSSAATADEEFMALAGAGGVRIERIVSRGHRSPDGFWYDQEEHEYVLLVTGAAELELDPGGRLRLEQGDWIHIPAHLRHRVLWTDPDAATIWLAVYYPDV
jgi:cupin 2 domain-containing protein